MFPAPFPCGVAKMQIIHQACAEWEKLSINQPSSAL
jgi:hypothetical protein